MRQRITVVLTLVGCAFLAGTPAFAQADRTWVSGVGDDVNPCSRTAPCKTFAGAISKTAAGGEISVLDPGGFGGVTITKSITINGDSVHASILASLTSGVIINGTGIVVQLRNLQINGVGDGTNGINMIKAALLTVDDVFVHGFATGIRVQEGKALISNSHITNNRDFGIHATGPQIGIVTVENSLLTGNTVAVQATTPGTVRLSNNGVYDNLTGFGCGTGGAMGTLASVGNNRKAGNVGGGVPACAPNATITLQ
jgi:hypothetical protein